MALPSDVLGARVRRAPVPPLTGSVALAPQVQATPDAVRYEQDGLRILVRGTEEVLVDWDPDGDVTILEALLYGFAARIVLLHRGTFSIHGTLVELDGRGIALGGHSGAGKSTTAVELARRHGGRVVIDDVLPIDLVDGRPTSYPFARPVHLTDDAFARAGFEPGDGVRVGSGEVTKLALSAAAPTGPLALDLLVVLDRDESASAGPLSVTELRGAERLRRLVHLSNVTGLSSLGPRSSAFFAWSTSVAAALRVVEVRRSARVDTLTELASLLAGKLGAGR